MHLDPPKVASAYSMGSLRCNDSPDNRWRVLAGVRQGDGDPLGVLHNHRAATNETSNGSSDSDWSALKKHEGSMGRFFNP